MGAGIEDKSDEFSFIDHASIDADDRDTSVFRIPLDGRSAGHAAVGSLMGRVNADDSRRNILWWLDDRDPNDIGMVGPETNQQELLAREQFTLEVKYHIQGT